MELGRSVQGRNALLGRRRLCERARLLDSVAHGPSCRAINGRRIAYESRPRYEPATLRRTLDASQVTFLYKSDSEAVQRQRASVMAYTWNWDRITTAEGAKTA
jgi:hypothetical protein